MSGNTALSKCAAIFCLFLGLAGFFLALPDSPHQQHTAAQVAIEHAGGEGLHVHGTVVPVATSGGSVLSPRAIDVVWWGPKWLHPDAQMRATQRAVSGYVASLVRGSSYMSGLGQYGVSPQLAPGATYTVPTVPPVIGRHTGSEYGVNVLTTLFARQGVRSYHADDLYLLYPQPGSFLGDDATVKVQGCAWHTSQTLSVSDQSLPYAVVPWVDDSSGRCDFGWLWSSIYTGKYITTQTGSMTYLTSHEIVETLTDPNLDAWGAQGKENEIGDTCAFGQGAVLDDAGYEVAAYWSDVDRQCVVGEHVPVAGQWQSRGIGDF